MSDMVADTFTVRDLNRKTAKVLEICDRLGTVHIRTRAGKVYSLQVEAAGSKMGSLPDFAARRRKAGMKRMSAAESAALDRLIGGE